MAMQRDFTPIKDQITLHGLGFIQVILPGKKRLHVWHPELPRRRCFEFSSIHNHRFAFRSTVIVGTQVNRRYDVLTANFDEAFGPATGSRQSYVAGQARVAALPDESYGPGESYEMPMLQYHETPNSGVVVTLMEKLAEGKIHASTLISRTAPMEFDQSFDRFQLPPERLWAYVVESLKAGATA